jgi:hypothetical protein
LHAKYGGGITDHEDGWFDASKFLLDYEYGVFPVPIFITEPAVGFGLAGVYFHDPDPAREGNLRDEQGRQRPSSITAAAVAATESGSDFGFRYLGGRKLGLNMGLNFAKGPEEEVIYVSFGTQLM